MRKNTIGTVFLVSILALAGIGVSFGGLTDILHVYGTATTGTVDLVVEDYSGTWVFKIWGFEEIPNDPPGIPFYYNIDEEILIYKGYASDYDQYPGEADVLQWASDNGGNAELISWSAGRPWIEGTDPYQDEVTQNPYDAVVEFHNLFPCIYFHADLDLHYIGTIPAKVLNYDIVFDGDETLLPDGTTGDWLDYLKSTGDFNVELGASDIPQLHNCQHLYFDVSLHIPQNNLFKELSGTGYLTIELQQWNDECNGDLEYKVLNLPNPTTYVALCDLSVKPGPIYGTYFDADLTEIPYDPDYNVWDGVWPCWCVDEYTGATDGYVELWDTYDPSMPYPADPGDWECVNWIINYANPTDYPGLIWEDIQDAIWYFVDGGFLPPVGPGRDLAQDAEGHTDFIPEEGQYCCVLLWPVDIDHNFRDDQITIIVVDP